LTRRRSAAELTAALEDPGFTPGARDVQPLVDIVVADEAAADVAARALLKVPGAAARAAQQRLSDVPPAGRARLTRLVGRIAGDAPKADAASDELGAWLRARLVDPAPAVRRAAANALGKPGVADVAKPDAITALERALAAEQDESARRAMLGALGKLGAGAALATPSTGPHDPLTEKARARAALVAARSASREAPGSFAADVAAPAAVPVLLHCRAGLEGILADELAAELGARVPRDGFGTDGRVAATLVGEPQRLLAARTMLRFGFPLPPRQGSDVTGALVDALSSDEARELLERWTRGPIRYRIEWARGGKRRAEIWRAAESIARARPELINDPTDALWDVVVHESPDAVLVELLPRFEDARFAYRKGDVPAASHPTVAAALVRVAGVRPGDVVWDPFVGSGLELCERALAGPYARLVGSDRDPEALTVARTNLESAGAERFTLTRGDALTWKPPTPPTLVITNPPMGRRVLRDVDLGEVMDRFVAHVAQVLAPGGRFSWMSPLGERTARAARAAGLKLRLQQPVDLGGLHADLQVYEKR
jgi:23S rRNA G2445 N2-methylase RlmL